MSQSVVTNIVTTIAEQKDCEPTDLEYTLSDHIDPNAVEQLADHETATWTLAFDLPERTVVVRSDETVLCKSATSHDSPEEHL